MLAGAAQYWKIGAPHWAQLQRDVTTNDRHIGAAFRLSHATVGLSSMALRDEDLTDQQVADQAARERSWTAAQRRLADPDERRRLEQARDSALQSQAPSISREEFLSATSTDDE